MSEWAPNAKIIHIDVDPAEISKNRAAHIGIAGQAAPALAALREAYQALPERHDATRRAAWVDQIAAWKRQHPYRIDEDRGVIQPQKVVQSVYRHHPRRRDRLHRRRPAPDVGRPALPLRPAAALDHLGRARHDGLRPAGRPRRPGRLPGRAGGRDLRRRLLRDDPPGALDRPDVRPAGQGRDPQQRLPGHGPPVAGALLGGPLRRLELRRPSSRASPASPGRTASTRPPSTTRATSTTRSPRPSPPTARRWWTCTSATMAKVFPMVPSGKGPDAIIVGHTP